MSPKKTQLENNRLKEYYVYELISSLTNEVFYVGKGKGCRINQHELDADNIEQNSPKIEMIRKIKNNGGEIKKLIIGRYDNENEALAVESTLIHWVYGIDNLKNITGGHGCDTIRPNANHCTIEGIDIPPRERSNNGEYSKNNLNKIIKNDVKGFMINVREELEKKLNVSFTDVQIDKSLYTEIYHELFGIKIAILAYSTKNLKLEVRPLTSRKSDIEKIIYLCKKQSTIELRDSGKYALIPSQKFTKEIDKICDYFTNAKSIIINIFGNN